MVSKIYFVVFLVAVFFGVFSHTGNAAVETCGDLGLQTIASDCRVDTCANQQGCYCDVAPHTHLCCADPLNITAGSKCYDKSTGSIVGSLSVTPPDATIVVPEEEKKVFFKPQFTLPGSKFIAGQNIEITGSTIGEWISAFYVFFVGIAGILSTVMIMWGGYQYVTSFGSQTQLTKAKEQIESSIIGLVLSLGAYIILVTINPALVNFKNLSIKYVSTIEQGFPGENVLSGDEFLSGSWKFFDAVEWNGGNVSAYDALITEIASGKVDRDVVKAIMLIESSGDPNAKSGLGACGLMQVMPATAGVADCTPLYDPRTNITAGVAFLQFIFSDTCPNATQKDPCPKGPVCVEGNLMYVAAAYNGGRGANKCSSERAATEEDPVAREGCPGETWWQCVKNPKYAPTREYVQWFQQALDKIKHDPTFAWTTTSGGPQTSTGIQCLCTTCNQSAGADCPQVSCQSCDASQCQWTAGGSCDQVAKGPSGSSALGFCSGGCVLNGECYTTGMCHPQATSGEFCNRGTWTPHCGNGVCDCGENTSACAEDCPSSSTSSGTCNNNFLDAGETCDYLNMGTATCASMGFYCGSLSCNASCSGFNTTQCTSGSCGDGIIQCQEQCEQASQCTGTQLPYGACTVPSCTSCTCGGTVNCTGTLAGCARVGAQPGSDYCRFCNPSTDTVTNCGESPVIESQPVGPPAA
ncbi:MAG: lytic transglycosylase domain-containing protein [Patescibacteria group bacterium]|jgi:hypothetical protein